VKEREISNSRGRRHDSAFDDRFATAEVQVGRPYSPRWKEIGGVVQRQQNVEDVLKGKFRLVFVFLQTL
jgi:hypothetical protein